MYIVFMSGVLGFLLCAVVIFFSGKKLSYYGEIIADLTGVGKVWIGLILLSSVTSLPELVAGISSTAIIGSADLAVGNILGSCAFNLCVLAMMDVFVPRHQSIFSIASNSHVLAAALGIMLLAITGFGLFLPEEIIVLPWLGITSVLFMAVYIFSVRLIYNYESKRNKNDTGNTADHKGITLKKAAGMYTFFGIITIIVALFLPYFAEQIANQTGLGKSFVGTLFLAASTSLPEIAVSIAAVRMGAIDLSVGNLLGSNIFNIFILSLGDAFYTEGHLLKDASEANMLSVLATIIMSSVAIIGLTYRIDKKRFLLGWDALVIFVIYIIDIVLLYNH